MIRFCCLAAVAFAFFVGSSDAHAQRSPRRVSNYARQPVLSPYLLSNGNQGGTTGYFSYVRPIQRQARINQQQFMDNRFFEQQLAQPVVLQGTGTATGPQAGMLRAGARGVGQPQAPAGFFNYSHYYNMPQGLSRR